MSERTGYIKLWRKSKDSRVNMDAHLWHLWTNLLMDANWSPRWVNSNIFLESGQLVIGRKSLSSRLGITESKIYRLLKKLEKLEMIILKSNSHGTVVTVCNWGTYQSDETEDRTTDEQPETNNENRTTNFKKRPKIEQPTSKNDRKSNNQGHTISAASEGTYQSGETEDRTTDEQQAPKIEQRMNNQRQKSNTPKNLRKEEVKKIKKHSNYPSDFEKFWNVYPRKIAKRQALKAWQTALGRARESAHTKDDESPADFLTRRAEVLVVAVKGKDMQYTKHAATWLNSDGWEDEITPDPPLTASAEDRAAWRP